ncbi:MAG: hypothetical protein A2V84_05395 [Chloroflexi bacterium RBG_16_70_13]|nr:MAG: hypothetical protein A2V84_05395 [Chloroflexi bacterium RBG_16_70_13]
MIRRPIIRRVSYAVASSLLAVMLLGPAGANAAIPALDEIQYPAPATVGAGELAAVVFGVTNSGKSTVSQLFLDVDLDGWTFYTAYPSQGTCTADGTGCTFGQLKPKKTASVIIVLTPTDASATVKGTFNTTGLGSGSDDASHGDQWDVEATVTVSNDAQDVAGRFIDEDGNPIVQNSQALSDTNPHSTKVVAPQELIGVSVQDGPDAAEPVCYLTAAECENLFGDPSVINVAQGGTFPGFQIVIGFDRSEIVGANANTLTIYHEYDSTYEIIDTKCSFTPNSETPKSLPCLTVKNLGGGDLEATIWTTHNGVMKGLG